MTFQQCLNTVSGIDGFCEPNTQYRPATPEHYPLKRPGRHYPY